MSDATMAAGIFTSVLDYATSRGVSRSQLLQMSSVAETDIADQDARVPMSAYTALIGAAMEATGDTALMMRHALDSRLETMSIIGQVVHSSHSMVHSIEQLNRYTRLAADIEIPGRKDRFELIKTDGQVWIVDHLPVPASHYFAIEASFARFISEFRRSFPDRVFELALDVTFPPPPHAAEYETLLRVPVRFNTPRNALRIDPAWIETQFDPGNEYLFSIFTRHADDLLHDLARTDTARALVETQILPELHEGSLSMDKVARALGMSRRTLHRRLKDEGVTFAEVHDALRQRMALDYLGTRKVSVGETAYLLGFAEASSFVRAFKRWTGKSPTRWLTTH